ncbi:hypothetical protein FRC11_005320 [Ceratobasidium sp. 423]|nr:hypothetical protein FRC11_005320 [Ceratobasidium sp. 423]
MSRHPSAPAGHPPPPFPTTELSNPDPSMSARLPRQPEAAENAAGGGSRAHGKCGTRDPYMTGSGRSVSAFSFLPVTQSLSTPLRAENTAHDRTSVSERPHAN